jgi:protein-tyrosine phosphatase
LIDLHSHILPGVDDGARTLEESVDIARAAAGDGITAIAATPHVREDYPTEAETMEQGVAQVRGALAEAGIELELYAGGELALDWLDRLEREEIRRFGLGGNPAFLLVEFPYFGWPLDLPDRLFKLRLAGFTPVLAHPERNAEVQEAPERLEGLVETGTLVQVTAASLDGRLGRAPRETGLKLVELGHAHLLASDAHHPGIRTVGMSAAAEAVGDEALANWLTETVPRAIVENRRIPERPEPARRRRSWLPWSRA